MPGFNPPGDVIEKEAGENGGDRRHHEKECHQQYQEGAYGCERFSPGPGHDHKVRQQHLNANQDGNEQRQRQADGLEQYGAEVR